MEDDGTNFAEAYDRCWMRREWGQKSTGEKVWWYVGALGSAVYDGTTSAGTGIVTMVNNTMTKPEYREIAAAIDDSSAVAVVETDDEGFVVVVG